MSLNSLHDLAVIGISNDGSASLINVTNLGLTETVQFLAGDSVAVDGEEHGDKETGQWYTHGDVVAGIIGGKTSEGWEQSTTAN